MNKTGKKYVQNIKNSILTLSFLLLVNCQYFKKDTDKRPVAKVYDTYLYFEDINPAVYKEKSPEDSSSSVRQYIENWAYKTLLIKEAERNVDTVKINRLARQYKEDLLTQTYKDLLLQKYIDTLVSPDTLAAYYEKYKAYFKAREPMLKPSFVIIPIHDKKQNTYKKWFFSDKAALKDSLIKKSNLFKKIDLAAQHWYNLPEFKKDFPVFKKMSDRYILKKSKKFVLKDSLSLYLVFINDIVQKDASLPPDFIQDDLKQLILSKRKQAGMSQLENEIKQEALQRKDFKIFKTKNNNE